MKRRITILSLAILFSALASTAQERAILKGVVIDNETDRPIPHVNVIVRGEKIGTSTDSTGSFRLELPTGVRYVLVFSHVAYRKEARPISFEDSGELRVRIYLDPEPIQLQEFVVIGRQRVVISKMEIEHALFQLSGDEFERLGEEDMEKAMQYLLPAQVKPLPSRMKSNGDDFTLYVNGEWKESIFLEEIDPFSVRRVLVWEALGTERNIDPRGIDVGYGRDIDAFPMGLPLRRGKYVILIETKQE
jgi:hypothetical protein